MVFETVHEILLCYNDILLQTTQHAYAFPTSYSLGKNKFEEVKKHLFEFLYMHKDFIKLNAIVFKSNATNFSRKVRLYYLDDASKLIDINSCLKVFRKLNSNFDVTTVKDFKKICSIKLEVNYNRKNTLRALKNCFGVKELSEKWMAKLHRKYFIGNKVLFKTYQTASYKSLLEYLKDYYLEHYRNVDLMDCIIDVTTAYTIFLCHITEVDLNSNDYLLHVRKFDEVLKEFYEFAVAHKSIIKLKNARIIQYLKTKTNFAKVDFDYSKNGLNFLNFNSLKELQIQSSSWNKVNNLVWYDCSFDFNNQNLKKVTTSSITKSVNSVEELKNLCYDTFLRKTKAQSNKMCSPYKELTKIVYRRSDAFFEGKVSCEYFNQLCSTYEGSTDENGELFKCSICLDELEIGAEVCRLPCGHLNCKTCIEEWFDIRTENSDESEASNKDDNDTSVEEKNDVSDKDYNYSTVFFNMLLKPLRFLKEMLNYNDDCKTSGNDEDKHLDEDPNLEFDSETSDEDEGSEATCLEKDDETPEDVYWNEYVIIGEDQIQEARNQCPLCKHICS